jgi:hypothetical protein
MYLTEAAPVIHKMTDHEEIRVTIPYGHQLKSSHKSTLDLPLLPQTACEGYTIPGLKHHSIFSVNKLARQNALSYSMKQNALYFTNDMK